MYEQKHQHCTPLCTDALRYMQWVERLPDGRLFTLMEIGKPDGPWSSAPCSQYLFGRISEDNGKTWGQPYLLYEWPERETTFCLQGWKSDRDGRIHVFASAITVYSFERNDFQGHIAYLRFDSYRGENPLYSDVPALYRYTGSLNNAVELDSGRLVFPLSTYQNGKFVSNTIWSDDHGQTWSASNDIVMIDEETSCESGAIEPVVAEVRPNVLVMLIRTVVNRIYYAVSYDGAASWSPAKPTDLPSSNAPSTVQKLADGRFFVAWNDCLGMPMTSVRYSTARQCLHAALSDDGLRTLRGVRVMAKKTVGEDAQVMNTYPTTALDGDDVLLKFLGVFEKNGSTWKSVQGYLASVNPQFLNETDASDCWGDWVCDLPITQNGISLRPTDHGVAHAVCNFPYASKGSLRLTTRGQLPEGCRILLSDCYLDRMNFYDEPQVHRYEQYNRSLYTELRPDACGEWTLEWDETTVTLKVDGRQVQTAKKNHGGFNHCSIVFGPQGQLDITGYHAHAQDPFWKTGIEY